MEPEIVKVDVAAVTNEAPQIAAPTIDSQLESLKTNIFHLGPVQAAERAIKHDARNALSHLGKIELSYNLELYREMHAAMSRVLYGLEILVDNISPSS